MLPKIMLYSVVHVVTSVLSFSCHREGKMLKDPQCLRTTHFTKLSEQLKDEMLKDFLNYAITCSPIGFLCNGTMENAAN